MKRSLILFAFLIVMAQLSAQQTIRGTVTDETDYPLPGVAVVVKNTLRGTATDMDGTYSITASPDDILQFTMIGMTTVEVRVGNQTLIDVRLESEATAIEDVVVIGYGAQKIKDLTAPIVSVKGEDLNRQIASNVMQALQGRVAGIQIINSGVPGAGSSVKIRGVGSIGDYANPLYVVDGIFVDNIDFLAAGDIEELTVLKDASASAIYGVRAANGVILITTRKGKSEEPSITYEGYAGIQVPVNIMPMATTAQYIELLNEANANITGYQPRDPSSYQASTDWYSELVRPAATTSHSIDISGMSGGAAYSMGGSYFYQDGIMEAKNNYQRYNFRGRLDQKITERFRTGLNMVVSNHLKFHPNNNAFFSAYVNPPVYAPYDDNNVEAYPVRFNSPQRYGFGNQYGNPMATAYYNDNKEKGNRLLFSLFGEYDIVSNKLTYKVSYNSDLTTWNSRNYSPEFNVGGSQGVRKSDLTKTSGSASKQIIDNLLTYRDYIGKHSYTVLVGQSTRMEKSEYLTGYAINVPGIDEQAKYLTTGSFNDRNAYDGAAVYNGLSFFTRATYNNSDKYLATVTFRTDASSKYQDKWGYFPSVGFGWVLSQEPFMDEQKLFDYLKVRVSWGMLGNDNVPANSAVVLGQTGAGSSGIFGDRLVDGIGAQTVVQNFLRWEVVNEFDAGVDFEILDRKIKGEIDYYHRVTNNVVFYAPIATGGGTTELLGNNGSVLNQGVEVSLSYVKKVSDQLDFNIGLNATTIQNKVLKLEGKDYIPGAMIRSNYTTRTEVGHPIGAFYGYEVAGVYESESKALQDPVSQIVKDKGFFRYKDQNGDKVINEDDKVYLGSPVPWLIAGLDLGLNYRNIDLGISIQGQAGNKILNAKRMNRDVFADGNYDQDFFNNRWTPDNTSDRYPSAEAYNYSFIQQANDFFVQDGSYVRIQNIQLGYTTDRVAFIPRIRIYLAAQRPFTFFTYNGFTPEVGGTPIASGIDNSVYPMQAIYTAGLKLNF